MLLRVWHTCAQSGVNSSLGFYQENKYVLHACAWLLPIVFVLLSFQYLLEWWDAHRVLYLVTVFSSIVITLMGISMALYEATMVRPHNPPIDSTKPTVLPQESNVVPFSRKSVGK